MNYLEVIRETLGFVADQAAEAVGNSGMGLDWSQGAFLFKGSNIAFNLISYKKDIQPGLVYHYDKNGYISRADGFLDDPYVLEFNTARGMMLDADWKALDAEMRRRFPEMPDTRGNLSKLPNLQGLNAVTRDL
ncbi:hypothetical protein AVMA1855_08890 [Acidovorax sp. SUPP1855]|uniref:hypothetical protein n=1 Tax=Acidovorax sp. SUPP1855 TaxID=431774 RepID=UPI0023DE506A|nr:hypothetical protein [Acidovorax sp. SUPP1855]GKS84252.1 hypothetical protein AVMA1855_08890 [Acidovorax sp. SUPP1855]